MSILNEDMQELRRLAANTYEQDKSNQIHRILQGITNLQNTIASLTRENKDLKNQVKVLGEDKTCKDKTCKDKTCKGNKCE